MGQAVSAAVSWHIIGGLFVAVPLTIGCRGFLSVDRPLFWRAAAIFCALSGVIWLASAAFGHSFASSGAIAAGHVIAGCLVLLLAARPFTLRSKENVQTITLGGLVLALGLGSAGLSAGAYRADEYFRSVTSTNVAQAGSALFPAGTSLAPAAWDSAESSAGCASAGCHADIATSTLHSRHASSAASAAYFQGLMSVQRSGGKGAERWCMGCHSPLQLARAGIEAGVGCLSCHAMSQPHLAVGNGSADYSPPERYPFYGAKSAYANWLTGFFMRLRPGPHRASLTRSVSAESGCMPCHRMSVTAAQNRYKLIAVDDVWGDWQTGPISGRSVHSPVEVKVSRGCIDCHHESVHRAGRTNQNDPTRGSGLSVEVFALRRNASVPGGMELLDAPAQSRQIVLTPGESVTVDVLVENTRLGHAFPVDGSVRSRASLRFVIEDPSGKAFFASRDDSPDAHPYGQVVVDRLGTALDHISCAGAVGTVWKRPLEPGVPDAARFRFRAPKLNGRLRLRAELIVSDEAGEHKQVAASHMVEVMVRPAGAASSVTIAANGQRDDPAHGRRFYAYGIALLAQRDLPRAIRAFRQAASLEPRRSEYLVGLARAHADEGDLLSAREELQRAIQLVPSSDAGRVWLGRVLRLMGQYDVALAELRPAADRHPDDAQTWSDIGLCLLRSGRYAEAIEPFTRMLAIDPTDVSGHLNLLQCYRSLRRWTEARREEGIYRALHDDLAPTEAIESYLRSHPGERIETAPIHEHVLKPLVH